MWVMNIFLEVTVSSVTEARNFRIWLTHEPMLLVKLLCNSTNLQTKFGIKPDIYLPEEVEKIVYMSKYLRQEVRFETLSNNSDQREFLIHKYTEKNMNKAIDQAETSWFYSCSRRAHLPRLIVTLNKFSATNSGQIMKK